MNAETTQPSGKLPGGGQRGFLHQRLRHATADLHRRSEDVLALRTRLADRNGYVALLNLLWRFHAGYESALRRSGMSAPFRSLCLRKADWIVEDLSFFDCAPTCGPIEVAIDGRFEALGSLYVLEGSMLGGRYIGNQAAQALGVSPGRGARFFHGYGDQTASTWAGFLGDLNRVPVTGLAADCIQAASCGAFRTFIGSASR